MITLSLNLGGNSAQNSHAKKVKELVGTHFAFPGSDKLKLDVNIKDNGASTVSFAGPKDVISEAKRLWQENVVPATNKFKANINKTAKSVKAKAQTVKTKVKKAAPKKKVVRASVKVTTAKKKKK